MRIEVGDILTVIDAGGQRLTRRAVSGVLKGHRFPVVQVCTEEVWQRTRGVPEYPNYVPWPLDAVEAVRRD